MKVIKKNLILPIGLTKLRNEHYRNKYLKNQLPGGDSHVKKAWVLVIPFRGYKSGLCIS